MWTVEDNGFAVCRPYPYSHVGCIRDFHSPVKERYSALFLGTDLYYKAHLWLTESLVKLRLVYDFSSSAGRSAFSVEMSGDILSIALPALGRKLSIFRFQGILWLFCAVTLCIGIPGQRYVSIFS